MRAEQLDFFWHCAQTNNPVLSYEQFRKIPVDSCQAMLAAGLLKEGQPSRSVECDGCDEGHVEEVRQIEYPDRKRRFFISCPQCSSVQVKPERLRQWVFDYGKIAELLHRNLKCKGIIHQASLQTLWNVGMAPLAGQSRPVWLARTLTDEVKGILPSGKQAILFVIFPHYSKIDCFDPDRTFQMSQLVHVEDNQFQFDIDAVRYRLGAFVQQSTPHQKPKRRSKRAATIDALKNALRNEIRSRKNASSQNWDIKLPPPEQKYFAKIIGVQPTSVHRALKDNDKELEILWQIVNDPEKIIDYSGF